MFNQITFSFIPRNHVFILPFFFFFLLIWKCLHVGSSQKSPQDERHNVVYAHPLDEWTGLHRNKETLQVAPNLRMQWRHIEWSDVTSDQSYDAMASSNYVIKIQKTASDYFRYVNLVQSLFFCRKSTFLFYLCLVIWLFYFLETMYSSFCFRCWKSVNSLVYFSYAYLLPSTLLAFAKFLLMLSSYNAARMLEMGFFHQCVGVFFKTVEHVFLQVSLLVCDTLKLYWKWFPIYCDKVISGTPIIEKV